MWRLRAENLAETDALVAIPCSRNFARTSLLPVEPCKSLASTFCKDLKNAPGKSRTRLVASHTLTSHPRYAAPRRDLAGRPSATAPPPTTRSPASASSKASKTRSRSPKPELQRMGRLRCRAPPALHRIRRPAPPILSARTTLARPPLLAQPSRTPRFQPLLTQLALRSMLLYG